jgi:tetratricopeptide (TPR) repeat protein
MDAQAQARLQYLQKELTTRGARLFAWRDEFISACEMTDNYDLAERKLRAWMAEHPEQRQQFQQRLIQVFLAADRPDDALAEIGALPSSPQSAEEMIKSAGWYAQALAAKGQVDAAAQELTALLSEPFVRENAVLRDALRTLLIDLLVEAGDYTLAITRCDRWLTDAGSNLLDEVEALVLKRHALQRAGRDREATEIGARLLELEPRDPGLNNDVGYTWVDRGEHVERPTEMIRKAVADDPMNPAFLDSLGWAYYKQGDFHAARAQLARAVQMRTGQDPVVFDHLGDTEYRLGDKPAARRWWEKALELLTERGQADEQPVLYTDLEIALRAKLEALDSSAPPSVAPTADDAPVENNP